MTITGNATGGVEEPDAVVRSESTEGSQGDAVEAAQDARDASDSVTAGENTTAADGAEDRPAAGDENQDDNKNTENAENNDAAEAAQGDEDRESGEDEGPGFESLGISEEMLAAVKKAGFTKPSPIQAETIPLLMAGRDVVGLAQTGTGKTAAFALPVLSKVDLKARTPQALVLAPTRELAAQVADSFQEFAGDLKGLEVLPVYGGQSYGFQLSGLRRGAQIIVGTPGRIIDHLKRGSLDISELKYLVLDEADEMLNMGFQEDVERILEDTPEAKQVALFSATMPAGIRKISQQYLTDPAEVTVKTREKTNTNITQRWIFVPHRDKLQALVRILEVTDVDGMIVFVRTKSETEEVADALRAAGFSAAAINGDIAQAQRERTVEQLKSGRLDILVATDVAARGLDVERISHVVNFDIPREAESYVHRIGRTGRAGRSGEAILFVTPKEKRMLRTIERATKATLTEDELPTVDEVNEARKKRFRESITKHLDDKQVALFRELVTSYAEDNDVDLADVAAALAAKNQGRESFLMTDRPRRPERGERDSRRGQERGGKKFEAEPGKKMYRIQVGKRHQVRPGAIVGALANEGGIQSKDLGRISIFGDYSLVELPDDLDREFFSNVKDTKVAGKFLNIEEDTGRPPRRGGFHGRGGGDRRRGDRGDRGGFRGGRDRREQGCGRGGDRSFRGGGDRFRRDGDRSFRRDRRS